MWPKRNTMMVQKVYHDGTVSVPSWKIVRHAHYLLWVRVWAVFDVCFLSFFGGFLQFPYPCECISPFQGFCMSVSVRAGVECDLRE